MPRTILCTVLLFLHRDTCFTALPCRHAHISRAGRRTSCQGVRFNDRVTFRGRNTSGSPGAGFHCASTWLSPIPTFLLAEKWDRYPRSQGSSLPGDHGSPVSSPEVSFPLQDAQGPQKCPVFWPSWACLYTRRLHLRQHYGCHSFPS